MRSFVSGMVFPLLYYCCHLCMKCFFSFGLLCCVVVLGLFAGGCQTKSGRLINGAKAPELLMYDEQGNLFSSYNVTATKQIILLDFWASWCKPCRKNNPELVEIYRKYKDADFGSAKGFTIISVSLDTDKAAWQNAIKQDQLTWQYHLCDLKGFGSPAPVVFQFETIPTTYLIDERGIIIGKDITLKWLDYELNRRLKNTAKTNTPNKAG